MQISAKCLSHDLATSKQEVANITEKVRDRAKQTTIGDPQGVVELVDVDFRKLMNIWDPQGVIKIMQHPCIIAPTEDSFPVLTGTVHNYNNTTGCFYHNQPNNIQNQNNVASYQQYISFSTHNPVSHRTIDNLQCINKSYTSIPNNLVQTPDQFHSNSLVQQPCLQVQGGSANTENLKDVLDPRHLLSPGQNQNIQQSKPVEKSKEFSWVMLEEHRLPVILIKSEMYIAVKTIESKILSNFPNIFPEEIQSRPPIKSEQLKQVHVNLMNYLNEKHALGYETFMSSDTMVVLSDFIGFYSAVKKHYPNCAEKIRRSAKKHLDKIQNSGWIQMNNTVVPFVNYNSSEFLPVEVLRNAAKLVIPDNLTTSLADREIEILNKMCSILRRKVCFTSTTKFVPLHFVQDTNKDKITLLEYLPGNDPMKHAKFHGSVSQKPNICTTRPDSPLKMKEKSPTFSLTETIHTAGTKSKKNSPQRSLPQKPREIESSISKEVPSQIPCQNSNTSHAETNSTKNHTFRDCQEEKVQLVTIPCCGKNMLSLVRQSGSYVLLEAVLRVFFPNLPMNDFINATNVFFGVDLPECTVKEEQLYKSMYGIPNVPLKCKKLLNVHIFQKAFPELESMFQVALYETNNKYPSLNNNLKRKSAIQDANVVKKPMHSDVICID